MKFKYTGQTRQRESISGVIEAKDLIEAKLRLRAMQVRPTTIEEGAENATDVVKTRRELSFGKVIDLKGIALFTRQFSSLISAGIPIVQCLDILWSQEKRAGFKKVLKKVKEDIEAGSGLAEALAKHPNAFSVFFIRIVEAGEISGTLDMAIKRVGQQLEKLGRLRAKVIGAMIYPCITVVAAIAALIFLLVKVIPEIAKLYVESNAQLPELTMYVLALSGFVQTYFLHIIGFLVGSAITGMVLYKLPGFRRVWDPFFLKVPLFGSLVKKTAVARFSRTMSTLIQSGVPLLAAFDICIKLAENLAVKRVIERAAASVQEGKSMAVGLSSSDLFPPMVIHMVSIGEMTGKLDDLMGKVADIYDDEVDDTISNITGLIQPTLIMVVGSIIAVLLLAMYLPIFSLADKVSS